MQWKRRPKSGSLGGGGGAQAGRQAGAVNERASERATSPTATAPTPTVAVVLAPLKRTTPLGAAVRSGPRTGPQPRPHHAMEAERGLEGARVRGEDMGTEGSLVILSTLTFCHA